MQLAELIEELRGTDCRCGNRKKRAQTFCRSCFFKLPVPMRRALYKRVGEGYEEAYGDAVAYLGLIES